LAEKLRISRKILGLSREKLAKEMGVAEDTLASWESRRHCPTKRSLQIIEQILQKVPPVP
jgi:DNA-binding transcriptional regulator YiaG